MEKLDQAFLNDFAVIFLVATFYSYRLSFALCLKLWNPFCVVSLSLGRVWGRERGRAGCSQGGTKESDGYLHSRATFKPPLLWVPRTSDRAARQGWRGDSLIMLLLWTRHKVLCFHLLYLIYFFSLTCESDILSIFPGNRFRDKRICLKSKCIKGRAQTRIFISQPKAKVKTNKNKQNG